MVRIQLHPRPGNGRRGEQTGRAPSAPREKKRIEKAESTCRMGRREALEFVLQGDPASFMPRTIPAVLHVLGARTHPTGAEFHHVGNHPGENTREQHGRDDPRPASGPETQRQPQGDDPGAEQPRKITVEGQGARGVFPRAARPIAHRLERRLIPHGEARQHQAQRGHAEKTGPNQSCTTVHQAHPATPRGGLTAKRPRQSTAQGQPAIRRRCAASRRNLRPRRTPPAPQHPASPRARRSARFAGTRCG